MGIETLGRISNVRLLAVDTTAGADQLCPECKAAWKAAEKAGREEVWLKIPEIFDLGTWESLRDKETKAHCTSLLYSRSSSNTHDFYPL